MSQPSVPAPTRPKRRRRAWLFVPVLMLVGLGLALVAFEVVLRLADPYHYAEVDDRERFITAIRGDAPEGMPTMTSFYLRPNAEVEFLGAEFEINAEGFRTPVVAKAKPADVYRIAVVGDSVPFGWGVPEPDCFPRRLETLLNQREHPFGKDRVEVLNLSGPGRGLGDYMFTLQNYGLAYDPDLVVIPFIFNDIDLGAVTDPADAPEPPMPVPTGLRWSWAARYLTSALNSLRGSEVKADYWIGIRSTPDALNLCALGFELIKKVAGDVPVVVLDTVGDRPGEGIPEIAATLQRLGIPQFECYLPVDEWKDKWCIEPPVHTHPNIAAHAVYADRLIEGFESLGLLEKQ